MRSGYFLALLSAASLTALSASAFEGSSDSQDPQAAVVTQTEAAPQASGSPTTPVDAPASAPSGSAALVFTTNDVDDLRSAYLAFDNYVREAVNTNSIDPANIQFAKIDLDKDGTDEVIVYIEDSFYCGTLGCKMGIFAYNGAFKPLSDDLTVQKGWTVPGTVHNGYLDLDYNAGNGKTVTWAFDSTMSKYNPVGEDGKGIDPSLQYQGNPVTGETAPIIDKPAGRQTQELRDEAAGSETDVKF